MNRISPIIKQFSRQLRRDMTDAEQKLWQHLRMRQMSGFKFRRQHPCGSYILDFACLPLKLAIELDGSQHSETTQKDTERTSYLEKNGWTVLRFWNNEVLQEMDAVLTKIDQRCNPHPNLPPEMGKELLR